MTRSWSGSWPVWPSRVYVRRYVRVQREKRGWRGYFAGCHALPINNRSRRLQEDYTSTHLYSSSMTRKSALASSASLRSVEFDPLSLHFYPISFSLSLISASLRRKAGREEFAKLSRRKM